jgi:tetratricopeptide (TPR) repeat protein
MNGTFPLRFPATSISTRVRQMRSVLCAALLLSWSTGALGQERSDAIAIEGAVRNVAGEGVPGASVVLSEKNRATTVEVQSGADGSFRFSPGHPGTYSVRVRKAGFREAAVDAVVLSAGEKRHVDLVLGSLREDGSKSSSVTEQPGPAGQPMELQDTPNFTVAGVTDWSNAGLHGSDTSSKASDALTRETLELKSSNSKENGSAPANSLSKERGAKESEASLRAAVGREPNSFAANHNLGAFCFASGQYREAIPLLEEAYRIDPTNYANGYQLALAYRAGGNTMRAREQIARLLASWDTADLHRLSGDLDERLGDPVAAVGEYQRAVQIDPSEENYFAWGTELLLHKAPQPAVEVFAAAASAHPKSARVLAGLGAGLYASGAYADAAQRLCQASDLNVEETAFYLFLGQMEKAANEPLPCAEEKLAHFAREQPGDAWANYYYAVSLWKRDRRSGNTADAQPAESLLETAVRLNPRFSAAYLELGVLRAARGDIANATDAFRKSVDLDPGSADAHYQLGLAYKRIGEQAKAKQEFAEYKTAHSREVADLEHQRRELRQFLIVLKDQPATASPAPR